MNKRSNKNSFCFAIVVIGIAFLTLAAGQQSPLPPSIEIKTPFSQASFQNPSYDTSNPNWARNICGNKTWLRSLSSSPRYEWQPILERNFELESSVVGVTGTAFHSELSIKDMWFTHPFGVDRTFFLASDPQFNSLMSPILEPEEDQTEALQQAQAAGFSVNNVLHVEMDRGFIPPGFETQNGDRVATYGRWIVDCGHLNFAAEIHPPLLIVNARATSASQTDFSVVSRPFLVSQEFGGDGLFVHLQKELAKVFAPFFPVSSMITARPGVIPVPFNGLKWLSIVLHPSMARINPNDVLRVSYQFEVRTGVAVQLFPIDDQSVAMTIVMTENDYKPFPLPKPKNLNISINTIRDYLKSALDTNVDFVKVLMGGGILIGNPFGAAVLAKGIDTDSYTLTAPSFDASLRQVVLASKLPGNTIVKTNDSQPWPILGQIQLEWVHTVDVTQTLPATISPIGEEITQRIIVIPANQEWVDTRINLQAGQKFNLSASGEWTNQKGSDTKDPDGYLGYYYPSSILPSANLASLIGKVGDKVFAVGSHFEGASPATGRLYLTMNDVPGTFADNDGQVYVTVRNP